MCVAAVAMRAVLGPGLLPTLGILRVRFHRLTTLECGKMCSRFSGIFTHAV